MRVAIWSYATAVAVTAVTVTELVPVFGRILFLLLGGYPLPMFTTFASHFRWCFPAIPIPFIYVAIWLTRSGRVSAGNVSCFAGVSTLVIVSLIAFTALALLLPYVEAISPL